MVKTLARTTLWAAVFLAVVAGMLIAADGSRSSADRARRAQIAMQRIHTESEALRAITWRALATASGPAPRELVIDGLSAYGVIAESLSELRALGVPAARIRTIEVRLRVAHHVGIATIAASVSSGAAAQHLGRTRFSDALDQLNATIEHTGRAQAADARAAEARTRLALLGSTLLGVLLVGLLAWRLHRARLQGERRLRALVRHSSDVVAVVDEALRFRWLAESALRLFGRGPDALDGTYLTALVHPDDVALVRERLRKAIAAPGALTTFGFRLADRDGHVEAIAENRSEDPQIGGILLNLRDVSERVALEQRLRHQAFHDALTGLAGRRLFEERLTHALARSRRTGAPLAVLFVDLDDFKAINDSLGHAAGDKVLRLVARRVVEQLRAHDTAARFGGDEFAVLLEDLEDVAVANEIAERLRLALEAPMEIEGRILRTSSSIGLTSCTGGAAATADAVLVDADAAMYSAKRRGKRRIARFEPAMRGADLDALELRGELELALARDELVLEYQPVVEVQSGRLFGVEALLRWDHPQHGRIAPNRFIPIAESTGLIVPIGRWVIETACCQLRAWGAMRDLRVSVNVSAAQLAEPGFAADIVAIAQRAGVPPAQLTLELTERSLMEDSELMRRQLDALRDRGVALAVDDFGSGFSGLSYLRTFPIDVLKIDRAFVQRIDADAGDANLLRSIMELGANLGMRVVVEGIETADQAELVRSFGGSLAQGFHFARPQDPEAIARLLEEGEPSTTLSAPRWA